MVLPGAMLVMTPFGAFMVAVRPALVYIAIVVLILTTHSLFPDAKVFGTTSGELVIVFLVLVTVLTGVRFMKERPKDYDDPS